MSAWHVHWPDGRTRALSSDEVQSAVKAGAVPPDALVWTDGMADWRLVDEVFDVPRSPTLPAAPLVESASVPQIEHDDAKPLLSEPSRMSPGSGAGAVAAGSAALAAASFVLHFSLDCFLSALRDHMGLAAAFILITLGVFATAIFGTWLAIALWRNPNRSRAGSARVGLFALLAGVGAAFELAHAASWALAGRDVYRLMVASEATEDALVTILQPNRLRVDGPIGPNFKRDILSKAARMSSLQSVEITSTGGLVGQALEVAEFIERHDINVVVRNYCLSACVLVAVGARETWADRTAIFGFHRVSPVADVSSDIAQYGMEAISASSAAYLVSHGVPQAVVDQAANYGPEQMLEFAAGDLLRMGVIQGILPSL